MEHQEGYCDVQHASTEGPSAVWTKGHTKDQPTGAERAMPLGTPDTSSVSFSQTVAFNAVLTHQKSGQERWEESGRRGAHPQTCQQFEGDQQGSSMAREHLSVILGLREECRCLGRMRERIFRLGDGRTS